MNCPFCSATIPDDVLDKYVVSLRTAAERERGSADHRALVIGDLTRKLEAAQKRLRELEEQRDGLIQDAVREVIRRWEKI